MSRKNNIKTITAWSVRVVLCSEPFLLILSIFISLLHSGSWVVSLVMKQKLLDEATMYVENNREFKLVFFFLILLALTSIQSQIFNGIDTFLYGVIDKKISGKLSVKLNKKMQRISPVCFEDSKCLEIINIAEGGKNSCISYVWVLKDLLTFYLPYFVFMGLYLFNLVPVLVIAIMIVFLPVIISQFIKIKIYANYVDESVEYKRQADYYEKCTVGIENIKETRLWNATKFFIERWSHAFDKMQQLKRIAIYRSKRIEFCLQLLTVFGYCVILSLLFVLLVQQRISIGAFVAVFSTIASMYGIMKSAVCYRVGSVTQNIGTIEQYINFMEWDEENEEGECVQAVDSIELKEVSFYYPYKQNASISNLSLKINRGEIIALVGENGAGKSTLAKIISGLYFPTKGKIFVNNQEIEKYNIASIRNQVSAVFQNYNRYHMTIKNNVVIADPYFEYSEKRFDSCCDMADFKIQKAKFIYEKETMLSRMFGSVDLSGGEWQRLAIARCFYRERNLVILDEPTAAIDPYEEKLIYEKFIDLIKGKTAIIVTHRLASARMADKIVVLKNGNVCEIGNHEQLLGQKGIYYKMYNSQKQWYEK